MKRFLPALAVLALLASCNTRPSLEGVADSGTRIDRVEPPCWWTGMKTPLQLLIKGDDISSWTVDIQGLPGVKVKEVHKAESINYLFVDVDVSKGAKTGAAYLVFSKGDEQFKYPYSFCPRSEGSAERGSFGCDDAVYLIMPDRFVNGDEENDSTDDTVEKADYQAPFGRHGGDIAGIRSQLGYIADLGMTAIWCTPLLQDNERRSSYHGYACSDYYSIDSRFGSNEDYRAFVDDAHAHGLKMIMDVVTNHCGAAHWWMKDLPFADWVHQWPSYTRSTYAFSTQNDPYCPEIDRERMVSGWFDRSMPDMNLDNPFLLQYFKQWAVWWLEWSGLDGFRVDTYPYNEKIPMSSWCAAVRNEYPGINIVGEVWSSNVPQVAYWQSGNPNKDGFDSNLPSIMDFCLMDAVRAGINESRVGFDEGMMRVYNSISNDVYYHDVSRMMIFPGNHDTDRIGDVVGGNPDKMKIVMALMGTLRGFPQIFAGDELMVRSSDLSMGHGGLRVEFPLNWEQDAVMKDIHDYTRTVFRWRKRSEALRRGDTKHFLRRDNSYAYFRIADDDAAFVFINNTDREYEIPWSDYDEIIVNLPSAGRDVVSGSMVETGSVTIVAPHSALLLEFDSL